MIDFNNFIDFGTLTTSAAAVIPVIVAVTQAIKLVGVPNKFAPIISIALGILVGFIFRHDSQDLSGTILQGVVYGLGASGLYSGVKTTAHAIKDEGDTI